MLARVATLAYGVVVYLGFLAVFLYAIGFVEGIVVPKDINSGAESASVAGAILINVLLLSVFAIQHTIMARPVFKEWWTKIIPKAIERSTFVLMTVFALALLYWQWRPLIGNVWHVENGAGAFVLTGLAWLGWLVVLASTFMIGHFDLFGLNQTWTFFQGREEQAGAFKTPLLYKVVRHPIMLGFMMAFWFTADMTVGHLLFATVTTAYILIAIQIEERDLIDFFGDDYREYRRRVPALLPIPKRRS